MSNRLPILAAQIAAAYTGAVEAAQTAAERAIEAGHALIEAKALIAHGGWLDFLNTAGLPERLAQRYMLLARSGIKSDTVSDLGGIKAALRYIATCRLPGEGKWLIVDRAREDADEATPFAYAVIKPTAVQDFFDVVVHLAGTTNIYWPIRAGDVWGLIDEKLPIPMSERIFVSSHADTSKATAPQEAITMIGNLPWSYVRAKGKVQDCIEAFTQEKFAAANEALHAVVAESWWWPSKPETLAAIADDAAMDEICGSMLELARQHSDADG